MVHRTPDQLIKVSEHWNYFVHIQRCTRVENPGGGVLEVFAKKLPGGSTYFAFYCIFMIQFFLLREYMSTVYWNGYHQNSKTFIKNVLTSLTVLEYFRSSKIWSFPVNYRSIVSWKFNFFQYSTKICLKHRYLISIDRWCSAKLAW